METIEMVESSIGVPLTFDDYLLRQAARGFAAGPPLRPDVAEALPRLLARMTAATATRKQEREANGLQVPAVLFLAVTGVCNLECPHCYTQGYDPQPMDVSLARSILEQSCDLGVSLILVTGGEPLTHREFMALPPTMPDTAFLVFSNGTLVPQFLHDGSASPNMLWAISADGPREHNDARRGAGTYDAALAAMDALRSEGRPFGFSSSLSADNVSAALSVDFVEQMADRGCRAGFFIEQIPGPACDPPLGEQIEEGLQACRPKVSIPLLGFPADEVRYGGCQAGGHGIIQISPDGAVEPCPAAHLAVDSLADVSLREALANPFLQRFRDLKDQLSTGRESCTYDAHREEIQADLRGVGARATD
jgi:MoaA/NifB/PqqE/SkfB family radical SAM enzyme